MSDPPRRPPLGVTPEEDESRVFSYGVPFAAALFVAIGVAGTVLGGWAIVQPAVGACDNPTIFVDSQAGTNDRIGDEGDTGEFERLSYAELTPAEQRAFATAIESPQRIGMVDGSFEHQEAFTDGVLIEHEGTTRYATIASMNECLAVDPLVFPLGLFSLIIGLGGFAYLWFRFS